MVVLRPWHSEAVIVPSLDVFKAVLDGAVQGMRSVPWGCALTAAEHPTEGIPDTAMVPGPGETGECSACSHKLYQNYTRKKNPCLELFEFSF